MYISPAYALDATSEVCTPSSSPTTMGSSYMQLKRVWIHSQVAALASKTPFVYLFKTDRIGLEQPDCITPSRHQLNKRFERKPLQ